MGGRVGAREEDRIAFLEIVPQPPSNDASGDDGNPELEIYHSKKCARTAPQENDGR